ncbi:MAG: RCKP-type rubredoxin-like domain-containing protein [Bacteroidota bacterium]
MAVWVCSQCGSEKESRCKPRKCPECAGTQFNKKEDGTASSTAGGTKAGIKTTPEKK